MVVEAVHTIGVVAVAKILYLIEIEKTIADVTSDVIEVQLVRYFLIVANLILISNPRILQVH